MKGERDEVERKRLSFNVTPEVRERLEGLQSAGGHETLTEALRRAISVYELVLETQQVGGRVIVERDGWQTEVRLI